MKDTGLNTAAGEVIVRQLKSIHRELYTRDQELTARLELIVEATRRLTACAERSELSRRLLETFANNLAADGGSLFLCHQDHLELVHSLDPYHAPASLPLPLPENSIFGQVLRTRIPLLIRDLERERTLQPSGWEWYKDGSLLVLPLTDSGDKIVALVSLHNKRWPPFTRQDLELGRILGALSMEALHCLHTKEYYKELIENCSDLISVIEADRTIRYVSPSVQNILGYRPEELIDTKAFTFIHPDEVEEVRAAFENGKKTQVGRSTFPFVTAVATAAGAPSKPRQRMLCTWARSGDSSSTPGMSPNSGGHKNRCDE